MTKQNKRFENQYHNKDIKKKVDLFQDDNNPWWLWALVVVILLLFGYLGNRIIG